MAGSGFHKDNGRRQQIQQELGGAKLTLRMGAKASGQSTKAPGLDRGGGADMGNTGRNCGLYQCSIKRQTGVWAGPWSPTSSGTGGRRGQVSHTGKGKPQYTDAQSSWRLAWVMRRMSWLLVKGPSPTLGLTLPSLGSSCGSYGP